MTANYVSSRQRCLAVIERFPKEQLFLLAETMENMQKLLDEAADMAFCMDLSERHIQRVDKDEPGVPFEDVVKELGFSMEEIADATQND